MILEIHDSEEGNSHAGSVKNLDYDYQAEQWVQDIMQDEVNGKPKKFPLKSFKLMDGYGVRATWDVVENFGVKLTNRSERFTGKWLLEFVYEPNRRSL